MFSLSLWKYGRYPPPTPHILSAHYFKCLCNTLWSWQVALDFLSCRTRSISKFVSLSLCLQNPRLNKARCRDQDRRHYRIHLLLQLDRDQSQNDKAHVVRSKPPHHAGSCSVLLYQTNSCQRRRRRQFGASFLHNNRWMTLFSLTHIDDIWHTERQSGRQAWHLINGFIRCSSILQFYYRACLSHRYSTEKKNSSHSKTWCSYMADRVWFDRVRLVYEHVINQSSLELRFQTHLTGSRKKNSVSLK